MDILGISAFYHDSAAAIVRDGEILAAAQEERFTRIKHDSRFPAHAVDYCLQAAGISPEGLDYVVFYEKPLLKFERLLETYLAYAPRGFGQFLVGLPIWLKQKLHLPREMDKALQHRYEGRYVFTDHHESHAASAFFPSPFEEAAILTMDGVGEWATASFGVGRGNKIQLTHELHFPHSLGLLYSAFTYFTGFRVNSGEYKLMGLAPYGEPRYYDLIMEKLVHLQADGSLRLNMRYFGYCHTMVMTNRRFDQLFGGSARKPEGPLTQREMDIAASIQAVTEEAMLRTARHVHSQTGMKDLALAGGVALNCVANGRILRETPFENVWIQPAAGDAGGALGAALFVWHQLLDNPRRVDGGDRQQGSLLGPAYTAEHICRFLDSCGATYHTCSDEADLVARVADLIDEGKVIGWFHGRMEFGPRALGNRSILGDARSQQMQSIMNLKIKFRESFRPFAPCVLREDVAEYFEMRPHQDSPYMLLVAAVRPDKRLDSLPTSVDRRLLENLGKRAYYSGKSALGFPLNSQRSVRSCAAALWPWRGKNKPRVLSSPSEPFSPNFPGAESSLTGLDKLKARRSVVPAVTHVDYSARIQTVDRRRHPRLHKLITAFKAKTGCPVIINTSFNIRGEPIVCSPQDAYRCFLATNMDVLVLENQILYKHEQPRAMPHEIDEYKARFVLD